MKSAASSTSPRLPTRQQSLNVNQGIELRKKLVPFLLLPPVLANAADEPRFALQAPQTVIARQVYGLHAVMLGICIAIAVAVFGVMLYSILRHRKAAGYEAKQFSGNKLLEIVWTVSPCLIVAGMAYPETRTVIEMKDTSRPDLTIKATGYQWKWRYTYLNENIDFYSSLSTPRDQIENQAPKGGHYLLEVDRPLVVPVGRKIRVFGSPMPAFVGFANWQLPGTSLSCPRRRDSQGSNTNTFDKR